MRCPWCGSPVMIRGSSWECGWCGDFGSLQRTPAKKSQNTAQITLTLAFVYHVDLPDTWSDLKKAYRLIFRSGLKLVDAIAEMEQELNSSPEIEHLLRFLRNCDRGLCRARER